MIYFSMWTLETSCENCWQMQQVSPSQKMPSSVKQSAFVDESLEFHKKRSPIRQTSGKRMYHCWSGGALNSTPQNYPMLPTLSA